MKQYRIISESKKDSIYRDTTEAFTVDAKSLTEAIKIARKDCRHNRKKFIQAKLKR